MTATSILESPAIDEWNVAVGDVVETTGLSQNEWNGKKGEVISLVVSNPSSSSGGDDDDVQEEQRALVGFNVNGKKSRKRVKIENLIAYCPYLEDDPRVAFLVDDVIDEDDDDEEVVVEDEEDQEVVVEDDDEEKEGEIKERTCTRHVVHVENGNGKKCIECELDLTNQYHVILEKDNGNNNNNTNNDDDNNKKVYYCEKHFVTECIPVQHHGTFVRWCTICHDYIPIRDGVALPSNMLDEGTILGELYPDSKLSDGRSLIFENSFHADEPYWAHRDCFECSFCGNPFWDVNLTPHGFKVIKTEKENEKDVEEMKTEDNHHNDMKISHPNNKNKKGVVQFFCAPSKKECNDGCEHKHTARQTALKKLQSYKTMSKKELQKILQDRKFSISSENEDDDDDDDGENKEHTCKDDTVQQLLRKIVITEEDGSFSRTGLYYEHRPIIKSIIPNSSVVIPQPSILSGDLMLLMGKEAPGSLLLDPQCHHGTHIVHWDTTEQRQKRNAVAEFFLKNRQVLENGRVMYTSFYSACNATIQFWSHSKRSDLFLSDVHEQFIPRLYWCGAVEGAVTVHGGVDYVRMAVAASLITSAMLAQLESQGKGGTPSKTSSSRQQPATYESLSASLSSFLNDDISHDFDGLLQKRALADALQKIHNSASDLFAFMDHPDHRSCNCLEYIATAAKMGTSLRLTKKEEEEDKGQSS